MIVRRLASRRLVKSGSTTEEPRRRRAARFVLAILIAGLLSFIAAWTGLWPFGNVQALIKTAFPNTQQLPAQILFPPVQPTHKTVDVYDPAPAPPRSAPTQPPSTATPRTTPMTTPRTTPRTTPGTSPRPTPPPDT